MEETRYTVIFNSEIVGENLTMDAALILIQGLAEKYYGDMVYGGKIELVRTINEGIRNASN